MAIAAVMELSKPFSAKILYVSCQEAFDFFWVVAFLLHLWKQYCRLAVEFFLQVGGNMLKLVLQSCFLLLSLAGLAQAKLQLAVAKDNLDAYIKMRASLDTAEQPVFYATGKIYAYEPDKPWRYLFDFEMYNIARTQKMPGDSGYYLLTREMLVYKDPKTGEILKNWTNPWTGEVVDVLPVWNDPVNQIFRYGRFICPFEPLANGRVCLYNDVTLTYPSPLPPKDWPANSRSEWYQGAELFNFFCNEAELTNPMLKNISADISWTRFSDFLPWMRMAQRPGNLLYQSRGYKLKRFTDLPAHLRNYVLAHKPEYATAPDQYTSPNMTSWRYFKKVME